MRKSWKVRGLHSEKIIWGEGVQGWSPLTGSDPLPVLGKTWERQHCVNLSLCLPPSPPPGLQNTPEPEEVPALGLELGPTVLALEPASPPSAPPDLERAPTSPSALGSDVDLDPSGPPAPIPIATTAETGPSLEPDYPQAVTTEHPIRREKRNILSFPARRVAEQLTLMDVVSCGALGVLWDRPSLGHQLPRPAFS